MKFFQLKRRTGRAIAQPIRSKARFDATLREKGGFRLGSSGRSGQVLR
jgi:hypothetical protein